MSSFTYFKDMGVVPIAHYPGEAPRWIVPTLPHRLLDDPSSPEFLEFLAEQYRILDEIAFVAWLKCFGYTKQEIVLALTSADSLVGLVALLSKIGRDPDPAQTYEQIRLEPEKWAGLVAARSVLGFSPHGMSIAETWGGEAASYPTIFVSHSVADIEFVRKLAGDLREAGIEVFLFQDDATSGLPVWAEIDTAIRKQDKVILVASRSSLQSGPVLREIERALVKEDEQRKTGVKCPAVLFP